MCHAETDVLVEIVMYREDLQRYRDNRKKALEKKTKAA
jgi:hypothetical protein